MLGQDVLFIDIETVPQYPSFNEVPAHWQTLFLQKVNKQTTETEIDPVQLYYDRAGILAEFGKVVCISTAILSFNDSGMPNELRVKSFAGNHERQILEQFVQVCNKLYQKHGSIQFAGHNIKEFDIPFICRRLLVHGLALPTYLQVQNKKPWEVQWFDTLHMWRFGDYKNYISLHLLANVLQIPTSKDDIDGSMVQHVFYRDNDIQRIITYCQKDVVLVANIILRFQQIPILQANQISTVAPTICQQ